MAAIFDRVNPRFGLALMSSLRHAVARVVLIRSKEEVVRPNAFSVVAAVQHKHPLRDRPVSKLPRVFVRKNSFLFGWKERVSKPAVSLVVDARCSPFPALVALCNLAPKAGLDNRWVRGFIHEAVPSKF